MGSRPEGACAESGVTGLSKHERAEFRVAGVDHHGNTANAAAYHLAGFVLPGERARDLSVLVDLLLADSLSGARIDTSSIGAAGFSQAGFSTHLRRDDGSADPHRPVAAERCWRAMMHRHDTGGILVRSRAVQQRLLLVNAVRYGHS